MYVSFDGFDKRYYISRRCYELPLLILCLKDQNTTLGTRGKEEGVRKKGLGKKQVRFSIVLLGLMGYSIIG